MYSFREGYMNHQIKLYAIRVPCSPANTLWLDIHCPSVKPSLAIVSDGGRPFIKFNDVMIGQKVIRPITVQNITDFTLNVRSTTVLHCTCTVIVQEMLILMHFWQASKY